MVYEQFPEVAIDLFIPDEIGVLRRNRYSSFHESMGENIPMRQIDWNNYPPKVYKVLFMADPEISNQVQELYRKHTPEGTESFFSNPSFFEIMPEGINKGSGLRELCQILGIPEGNSYAIGDFENDLEMLKAASFSAVPENGSDAVKAEADWIVCHCRDGAVADLIEKILEQRSQS
jgi:hydroxymethylpyrimidine pyrophosphatase-like HAD family hydrolase